MVGGWIKMLVTMVGRHSKILKLHWQKGSKTVPKNGIWARKYIIEKLLFGVGFETLSENLKLKNKFIY